MSLIPGRLRRAVTAALLVAATLGFTAAPVSAAAPGQRDQGGSTPGYYLALGDSLAAGYQTLPGGGLEVGHGYAQDIARTLASRAAEQHRPFDFTDLGCPGETTETMINGGCPFPHPYRDSQLAEAVAFLRAHHQDSVVVTLDIGANDVDGCAAGASLDQTCAAAGVDRVRTGLATVLGQLRAAAGPHTRIVGMNLYDPFLATWLTGPKGRVLAGLTVPLTDALNSAIGLTDAQNRVPTADVAAAFDANSWMPLACYGGQQVPLNVVRIMEWTNMSRGDIHANDIGYQVIADTFLATF